MGAVNKGQSGVRGKKSDSPSSSGRVEFVQSGGFGGFRKRCELNISALDEAALASLETLINGGSIKLRSPRARDLNLYDITIEREGRKVSLSFDDLTVPKAALPLLDFLTHRAAPVNKPAE